MTDQTKFAEMLCTRFCHDIIGPVGAVSNGAEFLREEMPNLNSQAMDLIEKSSREAVARMQYYRQAYGTSSKGNASLTETKIAAANFFHDTKIQLDWADKYTDMSNINISYTQKKLILNLLIIASSALLRGGKLSFEIDDAKIYIKAAGQSIRLDPEVENCLQKAGDAAISDPKLVQVYYTRMLVDESSSKLVTAKTNESLEFTITQVI